MTSASIDTKILFRLKTLFLLTILFLVGCDSQRVSFAPNQLLTARMTNDLQVDLALMEDQTPAVLKDLFGTPDQPSWPQVFHSQPRLASLIDNEALDRAAGPVSRDSHLVERGLYRKHCAQCHGITGDGLGPAAALLNPYPRDFRRGSFKFKSTIQSAKPTLADLIRTIECGIPGTSMPAMGNLIRGANYDNDIPILAKYVQYLAIRGEVERRLMMELVPDINIEAGQSIYDIRLKETAPDQFELQTSKINEIVLKVGETWVEPKSSEVEVIDKLRFEPSNSLNSTERKAFLHSAARGRQIFQGEVAACSQCHGKEADGRGKLVDFDEWTKDWTIRAGIDPKDSKQWKPLKKMGLLKPTISVARNLKLGVFHGGSSPETIYRSIVNGIDGTPMPAAARQPSVKNGLTEEQLWDLVNFCLAIGIADLRQALETQREDL